MSDPLLPWWTSTWDLLCWRAERTPDALAAVDEEGRTLTFAALRSRSESLAGALAGRGVGPGDRVAWMLPTSLDAMLLAGALARLGVTQVPLLPLLRDRELGFVLAQSGAKLLVVPGTWRGHDYLAMAASVLAGSPAPAAGLQVVSAAELRGDAGAGRPAIAPMGAGGRGEEGCWVFYTSGTTGVPKGAVHSDATVGAFAIRLNRLLRMGPEDRNALVFPITHIGGLAYVLGGLLAGYAQILISSFDPVATCEVLRRHGVSIAGSAPPTWRAYLDAQRRHPGSVYFPRLRALVGGGADTPSTMFDDVRRVLGVPLVTGYGLTECPGLANNGVDDVEELLRHDGRLVDGVEARVVRPDGSEASPGEDGEIRVKGPMLFCGYLDADLTGAALDERGFFRTGDVGRVDANGSVDITGRLKDIIIRKGENIAAKEVEDVLHLHPAIADAAVVGLPDPERGERCCAVIVTAPGAAPPDLATVKEHCRQQGLSRHKIPEQVEIVTALPRTDTGKVLKSSLRDRFAGAGTQPPP